MKQKEETMKKVPRLIALWLVIVTCSVHAAEEGLISHWLFDATHVQGAIARSVEGQRAAFKGVQLVSQDGLTSLDFNGRDCGGLITTSLSTVPLPKRSITVTAWVRVNKPQTWGGLLSCIQDNGDFERGWLLGYLGSQFAFGLASEGKGKLTYLKGQTLYSPGHWYHVAGTYDGVQLKVYLNGQLENSSSEQSGDILYPSSTFYEIGAYHDEDEYYHLSGRLREIRVYDRALSDAALRGQYQAGKDRFPPPPSPGEKLAIAVGPIVDWVDRTTVRITWQTELAMPSVVEFGLEKGQAKRFEQLTSTRKHTLEIPGIVAEANYAYRILEPGSQGSAASSETFGFDSTFYYEPPPAPKVASPYPADAWGQTCAALAEQVLAETKLNHGYCLILGAEDGRLAYELVQRSKLKIVLVETDPANVQRTRRLLDKAGIYGVRATVHAGPLDVLPYGPYFANLILSERMLRTGELPGRASQLFGVLRPAGGVAWLGQPARDASRLTRASLGAWLEEGQVKSVEVREQDGLWAIVRRDALAGGGSWSHQYGAADNSACSQDALVSGELEVLWWGEPGPRPMPDRGNRNPAPLSVNGHLFVQGNRILFGMDSYNGTIRWVKSVPATRRANMPRDCSNMAASADHLYVAQGSYCYAIEAVSGVQDQTFAVPPASAGQARDWGYLAAMDQLLLGSAQRPNATYLGDDGEWFEDYNPGDVAKVTSESLFALDRKTGQQRWLYRQGAIVNSTITVGDEVVYFVESRSPQAREGAGGRLVDEITKEQWLVALDLKTGRLLWERRQDFSACQFTLYLSYAKNTLIAMGTDQNKTYHVFAMEATRPPADPADETKAVDLAGAILWEQHFKADRDHHSGHLQRPVIVSDVLYTDKKAFGLRSGTLLRSDLPERRGCGTMSASLNSLFYRHHFHGQWDLNSNKRVQFEGIRSGCWLSMISAGGLMLAPETSAGCSCTHAIQTSVAYVPRAVLSK